MPIISANPTTGWIFGVSPSFNWLNGRAETTTMSTALAMVLFTTENQFFTSIRSNAFLKDDSWALLADIRYNINNQPTFGLGSGIATLTPSGVPPAVPKEERIFFKQYRFYGTALKKLSGTRFFYGLGYLLDHIYDIQDESLDLDAQPLANTFHHDYQARKGLPTDAYTQSGISLNAILDSRDNVVNPYTGQFAWLSYRVMPRFLGSTTNSGQLWAEYRKYFCLNPERPRHILGLWTYGWFVTSGEVPYMFLPALGWDMFNRSGRPYTFGRFRGEDLVYGELEWRFPLQRHKDFLGGVIFFNATSASSRTTEVSLFDQTHLGYGLGLRFQVLPKKRLNVGLDYGRGAYGSSGYFINIYDTF
jgi:outer membrane protein assembly factor BamA